jgi:hypothetical protein
MAWYAYDSFDPISISTVPPGWRAVYAASTRKGYETVLLIGWAVFRVSVRGNLSGAEEVLQDGNVIEGVIISPGGGPLVCALALDGFLGYLPPDQKDPPRSTPRPGASRCARPATHSLPPARLRGNRQAGRRRVMIWVCPVSCPFGTQGRSGAQRRSQRSWVRAVVSW